MDLHICTSPVDSKHVVATGARETRGRPNLSDASRMNMEGKSMETAHEASSCNAIRKKR